MKIDEEKSYNAMANDIKTACEASHNEGLCKRQIITCAFCAAGHLVEQGWRKEEEVQKETFYKIYRKIEDYLVCCTSRNEEVNPIEVDSILRNCGRDFGVEVEEWVRLHKNI